MSIISKHGCSDELLYDLMKREQLIHQNSNIPTPFAVKKLIPEISNSHTKSHVFYDNGELICLNFFTQLKSIVDRNLEHILKYSLDRQEREDLKLEPLIKEKFLRIRLLMNTDGAVVLESATESAYPVWLALADLPPILRSKFENIVLCSLWYGKGHLPWDSIFDEYEAQLKNTFTLTKDDAVFNVKFKTVALIADLVCKSSVLKMKRHNGFYGCSLCEMRGKHRFMSHCYPHNEPIKMRRPQDQYERAILFESGDVDYRKLNKETDPEIGTKGVQGYPNIFKVIPNLPLTAPIDTMHQLLKGVAKEMLDFLFEIVGSPTEIASFTSAIQLPSEFKRSVRSLSELKLFKANELKLYLLYLAPIVFRPYLDDDSILRDLNYLVFSLRSLYETSEHSALCGILLEAFCRNLHFKYPGRNFESINFHLLRHLAWQCETFGPLWTTSASLFESANHYLIRPVTGTLNTCKLLVQRFIRNRELLTSELENDSLKPFIEDLFGRKRLVKDDYCLVKTSSVELLAEQFPSARVFCRHWGKFMLDSACYSRSTSNSFVAIGKAPEKIGQILAFFDNGTVNCFVRVYKILETLEICLDDTDFFACRDKFDPLGFAVQETEETLHCSIEDITGKFIRFQYEQLFFIKLLKHFEHD